MNPSTSAIPQENHDQTPISHDAPVESGCALRLRRWLSAWHIWVPCLLIVTLAAPNVVFMLPATHDYLEESYQPLQALKFFKSRGQSFHKYGPFPNFLLAPGYATSIGYWYLTGSFSAPSEDYPYGFSRPHQQIGFLILQSRVLFVLLATISMGVLAAALFNVTRSRWAIFFAFAVCIATNYAAVQRFPPPKPDGPMLALCAAALAVYIQILYHGLTVRRGVTLSLLAVAAVSSKELAAPMFVFPYLALIVMTWQAARKREVDLLPGRPWRTMIITLATGIVAYALLNIVYAPSTWLKRMQFWAAGPGIDPEVWGTGGGFGARAQGALIALFDNFGPAGSIIALLGMGAFVLLRPRRWFVLSLPFLSVVLLGISRIVYAGDRFYPIVTLSLMPPIAAGLGALADRIAASPRRPMGAALVATGVVLIAINYWFATLTWLGSFGRFEYMVEQHVSRNLTKETSLTQLTIHSPVIGATRLEYFGYNVDRRDMGQLARNARAGKSLPMYAYIQESQLKFYEEAAKLPARARMLKAESNFDIAQWPGVEGLGYTLDQRITPTTPAWYLFDWMPAVEEFKTRKALLVYRRNAPSPASTRPIAD